MPLWQTALAAATLTAYVGFIGCLLLLAAAALYSRLAATALALVWATVLLPARPLRWCGFAANPLFKWAACCRRRLQLLLLPPCARAGCARPCPHPAHAPTPRQACQRIPPDPSPPLPSPSHPLPALPPPSALQAVAPLLPLLDRL
jgi:hypothetical protein